MDTLRKKVISRRPVNKLARDPMDKLIRENHLVIKGLVMAKKYDKMYVILSTGTSLPFAISDFPRLKSAKEEKLNKWRLIRGGVGIHWQDLDEDLSLKGFLNSIKPIERKTVINRVKKHKELVLA